MARIYQVRVIGYDGREFMGFTGEILQCIEWADKNDTMLKRFKQAVFELAPIAQPKKIALAIGAIFTQAAANQS